MAHSGASDRPKIKLQPTQYGKTNYIAKANSNIVHSSIRNETSSVLYSNIICSTLSAIHRAFTWSPAKMALKNLEYAIGGMWSPFSRCFKVRVLVILYDRYNISHINQRQVEKGRVTL